MKIGDLVYDYANRVGIITKQKPHPKYPDTTAIWVEMKWEHDSHGFRPLRNGSKWSGWYDVRDLEMYYESRC